MVELLMRHRFWNSIRRRSRKGFTLIEILVSMTVLAVGILIMGTLLLRASRGAEAASNVSFQTAALTAEAARLSSLPYASLALGTTCATVAGEPFPHTSCSTITQAAANRKLVKVKVTATNNPEVRPDSVMFERSITVAVNPLNNP
jgi:prepilin-type N-terminal cleavage/methylation domain-containing protein